MAQLYGNAIIGQSGGPTAAINATLSGVIRGCLACNGIDKIYGAVNGIEGVLERRLLLLNGTLRGEDDFRLLESTPAAALGSCRRKLPADTSGDNLMVYENLLDIFRDFNIRYFFYIGGNDSMDTVAKLSAFMQEVGYDMRVIGVPKTIDNDLVGTDHTPGFGSAAKFVAATMSEIMLDTAVYTVKAVTIVEIMGRGAGWLTAAAALPALSGEDAPDMVYLPESVFDYDDFFRDLEKAFHKHPNVVVAVSEGIRFKDGTYVGESGQSGATDAFGHKYLSGTAKVLENAIRERIGCKVRAVELNLPQRCAAHIASKTDLDEAVRIGRAAVDYAAAGETGKMVVFVREEGETYSVRIDCADIGDIANEVRSVPSEYINENGNGVTEACLRYLAPLILGEVSPVYENGIPKHFRFEKQSISQ
ncbi:MAG: 6-phosphofructokinase [Ruminococcus sp.]|nr:6-phosphofructokinase [Candidatus Apopatosoma intestinale]